MGADTLEPCPHAQLHCINQYEFIRKYRCSTCGETMMCMCDQDFALRFLRHQIDRGHDTQTGLEVPVTLGFQPGICRECRGLSAESHPRAETYGHSSKIRRYYWREIYFETTKRFNRWLEDSGFPDAASSRQRQPTKHNEIEREVVQEFKDLHSRSPKYRYTEVSSADVLLKCGVEIVDLKAHYGKSPSGDRQLTTQTGVFTTPEEAVAQYFRDCGFNVLECESRPFHVLFGVFMWLLIQDPADDLRHLVGFGDRTRYEAGEANEMVWTFLPKDFGSAGYSRRRAKAINDHFNLLNDDLEWLFDYWLSHSVDLRQYLWAHREGDVARARQLLQILPHEEIIRILRYLVESYWGRFTGWPDILVYRSASHFFVEVKGSGDKLREDQKGWIQDNADILNLPFKLARLHRQGKSPR